jgi:uncharacterized membrane protein
MRSKIQPLLTASLFTVSYVVVVTLAASHAQGNPIGFYPLVSPSTSDVYSFGGAISGNGQVAGGESGVSSSSPRQTAGAIWSGTAFSTATAVVPPASGQPWAYFQGLNADGTVGTGLANISTGSTINDVRAVPMRWTPLGGVQNLTSAAGQGHDISADGSVVVGQWSDSSSGASLNSFRWTSATGMVSLPLLPGATASGNVQVAYAISNNANVIVGRTRNGDTTPIGVAYAWTESLGIRQLALLPGATGANVNTARAIAWGANQDGSVIVGEARDSLTGLNAALWTFDTTTGGSTLTNLGDLPGAPSTNPTGLPNARARDVSADGKVVVGVGQSELGNEAFIWIEGQGMFSLRNYLTTNLGLSNLTGWTLSDATGISDDGRTIVGLGIVGGRTTAFVAVVPEPAIMGAVAAASALVLRRRRVR